MVIQTIINPNSEITKEVYEFGYSILRISPKEMPEEIAKYGSKPFGFITARDNNKLIGIVIVYTREVMFENRSINIGGIGYVCVHEDYRRKGVATQMMEKAMTELKEKGCDIAFLNFEDEAVGSNLYAKFGFIKLGREYLSESLSGRVFNHKAGMIAPVNSLDVFNEVLNSSAILDLQGQSW